MDTPGNALITLCRVAANEVLLVAPFIKVTVLERILAEIPDAVSVGCVTRWYPHEIAAGASDVEIWPLLNKRTNSTLWLHPQLHAKYYRIDDQYLIGSANLTLSALGWRQPANLELLLPFESHTNDLRAFENNLLAQSVQVDDDIYQQMVTAVNLLPKPSPPPISNEPEILPTSNEWLPTLRHPENLIRAYKGQWEQLSQASQESAAVDLEFLQVPTGLSEEALNACVGAILLQQPIVQTIDQIATTPQRFGAVKNLLAQKHKHIPDFDASYAWQTLMRWLLYFLPNRYIATVPNYSELFSKKNIPTQ